MQSNENNGAKVNFFIHVSSNNRLSLFYFHFLSQVFFCPMQKEAMTTHGYRGGMITSSFPVVRFPQMVRDDFNSSRRIVLGQILTRVPKIFFLLETVSWLFTFDRLISNSLTARKKDGQWLEPALTVYMHCHLTKKSNSIFNSFIGLQ